MARPRGGAAPLRERPRAAARARLGQAALVLALGADPHLADGHVRLALDQVGRALAHPLPRESHGLGNRLGALTHRHRRHSAVAAVDHVVADEPVDLLHLLDELALDLLHQRVDVPDAIAAYGCVHGYSASRNGSPGVIWVRSNTR